jgi:UDP-N-acetylglucosamine:LPS N-acetylglucosamine transferase
MKTIGIFTTGYGHESIARAIAEKIEEKTKEKYKIKFFFSNKEILNGIYNSFYRFSPSSTGTAFNIISDLTKKSKNTRELLKLIMSFNEEKQIKSFIKKNKVDLCISTYFICNPTLEKIKEEGIPLINIVSDPKTIYLLGISEKADINLVFDEYVTKNYDHGKMKISGWFVRNKFEKKYDQKTIRKKLKIDDNLTFLVASGSEGANAVLKILPSIINCDKKVNFIVACGNNEFLYNNILGIRQSLEKFSSSKAKIVPLGFTKDLHLYMQAADLVIGKAGPNTLFESVACETAFFAITHIHGQEDGNLDIINDYKLGIVEENEKKANQKLEKIIKNPKKIETFSKNIKALKKHNQGAIDILLKEIEKLIG